MFQVFIFSKDYVKLLKTVLPFVDKVSVLLLVVINAVLEFGDFSEDALIAALKCLTKLTTRLDTPTGEHAIRMLIIKTPGPKTREQTGVEMTYI